MSPFNFILCLGRAGQGGSAASESKRNIQAGIVLDGIDVLSLDRDKAAYLWRSFPREVVYHKD